jgi:hypothetical protein
MQVVAEDEPRECPAEIVETGIVLLQRPAGELRAWRAFVRPGLLVDREQEVEGVKQEVPRAAGGIEDLEVARVLLRPEAKRGGAA